MPRLTASRIARRAVAPALIVLASSLTANAAVRGERRITADTTLTDDQFGDIVFDADGVTLDCNDRQVHISSASKRNCADNTEKCGIVASGRTNVTIKNCHVVGVGFNTGVYVTRSTGVTLENVTVSIGGGGTGFWLERNFGTVGTNLTTTLNYYGFYLADRHGKYSGVRVEGTTGPGIFSEGSEFTEWYDLVVLSGEGDGYYGIGDTVVDIDNSEFSGNANAGFYCRECNQPVLRGSLFFGNMFGILLHSSRTVDIHQNVAELNTSCDASAFQTTGRWFGNFLPKICGSVPAIH